MSNATDFVNSLAVRFPAGTFDVRSTPDGKIFRVSISTDLGRFNTVYSRYLLPEMGHENCATYMQDASAFDTDARLVAEGYENAAREVLSDSAIIGGNIPEVNSGYDQGTDIVAEQTDLYEFSLGGLVGGPEVMSFSHAMGGFISIVSARELRPPPELEPRVTVPNAFAEHCFNPTLTSQTAAANLPARHDFYDLRPFSAANPVAAPTGRPATPGTDRRCEVAFDEADIGAGIAGVLQGLAQEGINEEAEVPVDFPAQDGALFVAARYLNPNRIAVVQVGTRPGPNGVETFINVERLNPLNDQN